MLVYQVKHFDDIQKDDTNCALFVKPYLLESNSGGTKRYCLVVSMKNWVQ